MVERLFEGTTESRSTEKSGWFAKKIAKIFSE
jgi:hypothetical protein